MWRRWEDFIVAVYSKKLAYESEVENIVVGFSEDNEPIWLEILDVPKDSLPKLNNFFPHMFRIYTTRY